MKHKHVKSKSPRAKVSIVIEKLEKKVDKADAVSFTCVSHVYCIPPV